MGLMQWQVNTFHCFHYHLHARHVNCGNGQYVAFLPQKPDFGSRAPITQRSGDNVDPGTQESHSCVSLRTEQGLVTRKEMRREHILQQSSLEVAPLNS